MEKDEFFIKRIRELANLSYQRDIVTFSDFLNLNEQNMVNSMNFHDLGVIAEFFGGYEGAERRMIRFGSPEELGYEQEYPLILFHITLQGGRFSEKLSHRDYLGALMHLGIERSLIGDILVMDQEAYVFVKDAIGPFLMQEWTKVRHTQIFLSEIPLREFDYQPEFEERRGFCPSFRADVLVGFLCKISRKESSDLIKGQKVFVNGGLVTSNSLLLKEGDILSVRGYGKAVFSEVTGQSKKGRYGICMKQYK